jgi:hypothetical protein
VLAIRTGDETSKLLEEFYHATHGPWNMPCTPYTCWLANGTHRVPSIGEVHSVPRLLPPLPAALCVGTVFCDWVGVSCFIDGQGVWVALNLPSVGLLGSIPASWSRFCTLTSLALDDNYLVGTLPAFGLEMTFPRLRYLSLQQNLFYGPLPDYYGTRSLTICLVYHFCI